jgi:hypothetical protein
LILGIQKDFYKPCFHAIIFLVKKSVRQDVNLADQKKGIGVPFSFSAVRPDGSVAISRNESPASDLYANAQASAL